MTLQVERNRWLPIRAYRDFYDVPRIMVVEHDGFLLFDCAYDAQEDDYAGEYSVGTLERSVGENLPDEWRSLQRCIVRRVGRIPVEHVEFDRTRRRAISLATLSRIRPLEEDPSG